MQMPIKRSEYPFLKYDSFIAAHELNILDKSLLSEELISGETSIKGCLHAEDMNRLLEAAKTLDLFYYGANVCKNRIIIVSSQTRKQK